MNEHDEPSTRARWLGVVLILVALSALVWQAWVSGLGDELPPADAPRVSASNPLLSDMLAGVDSAKMGMQAASAAAALGAIAPLSPDETELCGLGRVKADGSGRPKDPEPLRLAAQRGRERLLPVLLNSPDELTRAVGLLLQGVGSPGGGDSALPVSAHARDTLAQMAMSG
ncbi:MAG: hypothetical protein H7Y33_04245, partial [Cytophagales bacterium]|nr:hypothetical protein [Rhizobacter sp.]